MARQQYKQDCELSDYKWWQLRQEELCTEARKNKALRNNDPNKWDTTAHKKQLENIQHAVEKEKEIREKVRDGMGENANEGHDKRIQNLTKYLQDLSEWIAVLDGAGATDAASVGSGSDMSISSGESLTDIYSSINA